MNGNAIAQQPKVTLGITGLSPQEFHRQGGLAPRCRLITSSGAEVRPKGWAVRPLKRYASWSSERRETVRSLSVAGAGYLRRSASTGRTRVDEQMVLFIVLPEHSYCKFGMDKR